MAYQDPDQLPAAVTADLVANYQATAKRLREIVLNPPGKTSGGQEFSRARAAQQLAQVAEEIHKLKSHLPFFTTKALREASEHGQATADRQMEDAGVKSQIPNLKSNISGSFALVDHGAMRVLARDTVGDLTKAADSMGRTASGLLHRMAATGVTNKEVNDLLAGRVITGDRAPAIRQLRDALKAVHGEEVTIINKNGNPMTFDVGYYARMVVITKTREASCKARHERLAQQGIDLVQVQGRISKNFCSAYLGKVFSISGKSDRYPSLSELPGGGPPFHPNCSKGTAPFIEALVDPAQVEAAQPDPETDKMLNVKDRDELQKRFQALHLAKDVEERMKSITRVAGRKIPPAGRETPERLEQMIRDMGVKDVDIDRRPAIGRMAVQGLQKGVSAGFPLPTAIRVTAAGFGSTLEIASTDIKTGVMSLNLAFPGWRDLAADLKARYDLGVIGSDNPAHPVLHEMAHLDAARRGADYHQAKLDPADEATAQSVSKVATFSKTEFLAEAGAALAAGRKLTPEVMALYRRLLHVRL